MRIGLVTDVPDDAVIRRVEHVVQRHRQFDDTQPGAEMPAGDRDGTDGFGAKLIGKLSKIGFGQLSQLIRRAGAIEQWRLSGHDGPRFERVPAQALHQNGFAKQFQHRRVFRKPNSVVYFHHAAQGRGR